MTHIFTEFINLVCATIIALIIPLGTPINLVLCYFLSFSSFRWYLLLYLAWILIVETKIAQRGGRPVKNALKPIWDRAYDYFRIKTVCAEKFKLDPKRNYLFCGFPHGFISIGSQIFFNSNFFITEICNNHKKYLATLNLNFYIPFQRELLLALGFVSASADSLKYLLSNPSGGNIVGLLPGGSEEVFYTNPHNYKFVLKKRKGFVKIALMTGTSIVPVIAFGENEIYNLIDNYYFYKFGRLVKKLTGVSFVLPKGRWFTWIPNKVNVIIAGNNYFAFCYF